MTVPIVLQERRVVTSKKKPSPFLKKFLRQSQPSTPEPEPKSLKGVQIWNKRIRFRLLDDLSHLFNSQIILFNFNLQSTSQITVK